MCIYTTDSLRKSVRSEQRSLLARRTTDASVKEEDDEDEDDDETGVSKTVGRLSGLMTNLLNPTTTTGAAENPKQKPRPLLRGATVGATASGSPLAIRKTLKDMYSTNRSLPTPTTAPTVTTPAPATPPEMPPNAVPKVPAPVTSNVSSPPTRNTGGNRSLNRGVTDSSIPRPRSGSDGSEIPGPPSGTPPSPSQMLKAKTIEPAPVLKPSETAAANDPVDLLMEKFGTFGH